MSKPNSKKIKTKSKHHHILFKQRAKELKASRPLPAKAKAHLREKETIDQASSECTSTEQDREVETGSANHKSSVASSINYVAKRKRKNFEGHPTKPQIAIFRKTPVKPRKQNVVGHRLKRHQLKSVRHTPSKRVSLDFLRGNSLNIFIFPFDRSEVEQQSASLAMRVYRSAMANT